MSDGRQLDLVVNGRHRAFDGVANIAQLVAALDCDPRTVAVEHNGGIVRRADYASTLLEKGDRLEIVRFVQGG